MDHYTVTFLFTEDTECVWLIEKQKPEWQRGCLNGIGGKIEPGETPLQCALRELKEEAGITLDPDKLIGLGEMHGVNNDGSDFQVYIFTGKTDEILKTQESENIGLYWVDEIKLRRTIENIPMLIETCIYRLTGKSFFHRIVMFYNQPK